MNSYAGRDSMELLRQLAPRGTEQTKATTEATCKMLHMAFKQQTTEDIYDTLVFRRRAYEPALWTSYSTPE